MKKFILLLLPVILLSLGCKKKESETTGGGGTAYYLKITAPADSALVSDTVQIKWVAQMPAPVLRFEYYIDFVLAQSFDSIPPSLFFFPSTFGSGTRHTIQLKAYISSGTVYNSNILTLRISRLLKPEVLSFTNVDKHSVSFEWSDAGLYEKGYRIERWVNNGTFQTLASLPPNTTQYTDIGIDSTNQYGYRIVAFNDNEQVYSDQIVASYNTSNFHLTHEFHLQPTITGHIAVDPQGERCVATRYDETPVPMIYIKTGVIFMLDGNANGSSGVDFNPDGTLVSTGGYYENKTKIWNADNGTLYKEISCDNSGIFVITFNDAGDLLAEGGFSNTALYRVSDGSLVKKFSTTGITRGLAFTHDGTRLLSGGNASVMELWDISSGQLIRTYTGHEGNIGKVVFNNDESLIYSASYEDNTIKRWQTATGQMTDFYSGTSGLSGLICLPDNKIACSDQAGKVIIFTAGGQPFQTMMLAGSLLDMDYCKSQDMLVCYGLNGGIWCLQRTGHWEAIY